jgi:hypothetical protein
MPAACRSLLPHKRLGSSIPDNPPARVWAGQGFGERYRRYFATGGWA